MSEIWSYLAVGLLFGLTLPGVSAHGFLRGGGRGKRLYSSKSTIKPSSAERQIGGGWRKTQFEVDRKKEEELKTQRIRDN